MNKEKVLVLIPVKENSKRLSNKNFLMLDIKVCCECGCGKQVNYRNGKPNRFIYGHVWVGKIHTKESREKMSESSIGRKHTKETRAKLSKLNCGKNNNFYGKKHSEETGKKMSISRKGKKHSEKHKNNISKALMGHKGVWKGKKFSKKHRDNISKSNIGKNQSLETRIKSSCTQRGINRESWKNFVSQEPYCSIWTKEYKEFIKERDNYQCQNPNCWNISKRLCGHHIDYDKKNCDPWNVITVCTSCNSRANFNREFWKEFYINIIEDKG